MEKAVGLIIGANLGTTATSWLLSLNAVDGHSFLMSLVKPSTFSPFLAIIGVGLVMFAKSQRIKTAGTALLGFSVMMIGMNMMSSGVSPLKDIPALKSLLVSFSNPFLGFGFALLFTMLIQSSDATVGIVQAFALSVGITFGSAIPLICGAHVGTCITALISSLGSSNNGKRTAFINLYYNLFKVLPFMIVFYILNAIFHFGFLESTVGAVGIPMMHTLINMIGSAIWLPGAGMIVMLARKTIPLSKEEKEEQENTLAMLDPILLSSPSFALEQTETAVNLLAETVSHAVEILVQKKEDPDSDSKIRALCKRGEMYKNQIADYLTDIASENTLDEDAPQHTLFVNANTALGRIGTVTLQILDRMTEIRTKRKEAIESIEQETFVFGQAVNEIISMTVLSLKVKEPSLFATVQIYHEEIARMTSLVTMRHIEEMHKQNADHLQKSLFSDLLFSEERLIDCCDIIADALVKYAFAAGVIKDFTSLNIEEKRRQVKVLFQDKYELLGLQYGDR